MNTKTALDLACGTGLSTFELCSHYQRTLGVDISEAQIEQAREQATILDKSVEFIHAAASQLPFPDSSVDLLTCAMAWHWLDPSTVFTEIDRVLKSPGALAVYSYGPPTYRHNECNRLYHEFINTKCTWPVGSHGNMLDAIKNHYRTVSLPFPLAERHDMIAETVTDLEHLHGYLMSLDGYETYCKDHPEDSNALDNMIDEMKKILLKDNPHQLSLTFDRPYFMLLALK